MKETYHANHSFIQSKTSRYSPNHLRCLPFKHWTRVRNRTHPARHIIKPKTTAPKVNIDDIAGCLAYQGKAKTIEEMNDAIRQGIIAE
jgi:hypothetical protein